MARSADPVSYATVFGWVYNPGISLGVLRPDDRAIGEIEGALRIAERSGDDLALTLAEVTLGDALVHRPSVADRERGENLLIEVSDVFLRRGHNLGELPIVNVWFDTLTYDGAASNIVERQKIEATYNIDCYGYGVSVEDGSGHMPGDQTASLECQRALRLVRRILMSAHYVYLGLRGVVWKRWPQSVSMLQPQIDDRAAKISPETRVDVLRSSRHVRGK